MKKKQVLAHQVALMHVGDSSDSSSLGSVARFLCAGILRGVYSCVCAFVKRGGTYNAIYRVKKMPYRI